MVEVYEFKRFSVEENRRMYGEISGDVYASPACACATCNCTACSICLAIPNETPSRTNMSRGLQEKIEQVKQFFSGSLLSSVMVQ